MTDDKALVQHRPSALDVYGEGDDIKKLAKRLQLCLPGGSKLNEGEAIALSQLAVTYQLNPFNGEVWYIPGKGTMVGIKGLRKAARKQAQYWIEHIPLSQTERQDLNVPDKAIAYKALVYRSDLIRQSAEAIKLMHDAGMKDAAERYAYKPTVGIGYWTQGEQTRAKPDQVARKRAEADALKVAFDLPFAAEIVGIEERIGYVDAEEWEVMPNQDWDASTFEAGEPEAPRPETAMATSTTPAPMRDPKSLYDAVNAAINYYHSMPHMLNTMKKLHGENYQWPVNNATEYEQAFAELVDHAKVQLAQKVAESQQEPLL